MKKTFFLGIVFLCILALILSAQVPRVINYQGMLYDAKNRPIANSSHNLQIRIYDAETGGTALWEESHTVQTFTGVIDINLGTITPLDLAFDKPYWLGVSLDGETEFTPRLQFTSSPYSFTSETVVDSAITAEKIARGAVVRSLNSLSDNITLAEGNNVSITLLGNTLTISLKNVNNEFTLPYEGETTSNKPAFSITNNSLFPAIYGMNEGSGNNGIIGEQNYAVYGKAQSDSGKSVYGEHPQTGNYAHLADLNFGLYGQFKKTGTEAYIGSFDYGAKGRYKGTGNYGIIADTGFGVFGSNAMTGSYGYLASGYAAVYGKSGTNGNYGFIGSTMEGLFGKSDINGNYGRIGEISSAVEGKHEGSGNFGYIGYAKEGGIFAMYGKHDRSGNFGFLGSEENGVLGTYQPTGTYAYLGNNLYGVKGHYGKYIGNYGILGSSDCGVYGKYDYSGIIGELGNSIAGAYGANYQLDGFCGAYGIKFNSGTNYWGSIGGSSHFEGNLSVTGSLLKTGGSFTIDHPLDPENQFLNHSFVESPDMMNVYDGNVILDAQGEATVELPEWFEALNKDFRYQITCIDGFAPVYIAEKVHNNRFGIAGGTPGIEVSWQVTGIRKDPYAQAHRIKVEEDKPQKEKGYYLYPELYGQPEEKQVEWAKNPEMMQKVKLDVERYRNEANDNNIK